MREIERGNLQFNMKKLFRLTRKDAFLLIVTLLFAAIAAFLFISIPLLTRIVVDNVINEQPFEGGGIFTWLIELFGGIESLRQSIWLAGVMLLLVSLVQVTFMFLRGRMASVMAENIAKGLKDKLYNHIQKLPYDYHVKSQAGDLIQRCTSDVETVRVFYNQQAIEVVRSVFLVAFATVIMVTVDLRMTFASLFFLPFIFAFSFFFFRYVKKTFKLADEKEGELQTVLQESLSGIRVIRAFGRGKFELERFEKKNDEFRQISYQLLKRLAEYWSITDVLCHVQALIVLVYGVYLTYTGQLTVGEFILFNSYVNMMVWPARQLGRVLSDTGRAEVAIGRIYEILETPAETDTEGATPHDLKGEIVFDQVSFAYDKGKKVLNNLSFKVNQGETIAILGSTGSGKSTLMHILLRLYDIGSGKVWINGRQLQTISKEWLRQKIGIVLQEPFLYSRTIKHNLKMAKDELERDEMVEATTVANVHHVIEEFDKGYDTLVGEKGVTLSGGQKQRVAIARTLIRNSEILIFDDSLSAVDTETDKEIRRELKKRGKDITTFIISQRITTLMDADRIFVMERGAVTDSGTHEELIQRDGLYARIWKIQSMEAIDFEYI